MVANNQTANLPSVSAYKSKKENIIIILDPVFDPNYMVMLIGHEEWCYTIEYGKRARMDRTPTNYGNCIQDFYNSKLSDEYGKATRNFG
jgi:hypothetical protein